MSDTAKPRILAVDDSRVMRRAMAKVLGTDYEVIEAEHGEDAWTLLLNEKDIKIIFTDLSMPYLDGFGLLERIRNSDDEAINEIPVIIITGKEDDDETKARALEKGANDFITKPFDSIQLQTRAKTHISFKETSQKLNETSDKLEQQAAVDLLTGLGGKRYFCKAAEEQLAYINRHGGQIIVMRIDIDHFNDIFIKIGKENSAQILKLTGASLSKIVRKEDMVARIGLAKFALFMRDTSMEDATQSAQRILEEIANLAVNVNSSPMKVSASIGILEPVIEEKTTAENLITETEKYLAKAVGSGGNQVAVKSLRKAPLEKVVSIQTALHLLEFGHEENLKPHVNHLATQLLPLLKYLAENLDGPAAEAIANISGQFKSD